MFGLGVEGDRTAMDPHALPQNLRRIVFAMNRLGRTLFGSTRPCQYHVTVSSSAIVERGNAG